MLDAAKLAKVGVAWDVSKLKACLGDVRTFGVVSLSITHPLANVNLLRLSV